QGETNAPRAFEYRTLYPTMIKDWRARWKNDLPFIGVQLPPYWGGNVNGGRHAALRDAQLPPTKKRPEGGPPGIRGSGDEKDIHPSRKEPVGERLALNARALAYGEKIEYSGPIYKKATFDTGAATITFDHFGGGLVAKDGDLTGFTIAGKDGEFHPAKA